jgi:hypothetical protein
MEDEMGGPCSAHLRVRNAYRIFVGRPEGKRPLENLGVDGKNVS